MSNTISGGESRTLENWRQAKGLTYQQLATLLGVTWTTAWAYCQTPEHARSLAPRKPIMERLLAVTEGAVDPATFYRSPQREAA